MHWLPRGLGDEGGLLIRTIQRPNSMLSFEKDPFMGVQNILEKLTVRNICK